MMNQDDILFLQIHDYLNGDLSGEEKKLFEEKIAQDTSLRDEVEFQKLANTLVVNNRLLDAAKISKETITKTKTKNKVKKSVLVTGLLGIVISGGILGLWSSKKEHILTPKEDTIKSNPSVLDSTKNEQKVTSVKPILNVKSNPKEAELKTTTTKTVVEKENEKQIENSSIREKSSIDPKIESKTIQITEESKINPCLKTEIMLKTAISDACMDENNGNITIISINGGLKPYNTQVFHENTSEKANSSFLSAGKYSLVITDQNNCTKSVELIVHEKDCQNYDVVFNPYIGEVWELKRQEKDGVLTVFQKNGQKLIEEKIKAFESFTWDGKNQQGNIVDGYFIFVVKFVDGSQISGELTVTK